MFSAASDRALGIPVVVEAYPEGEEGIQKSLQTICRKIREGMGTAIMKSFAGNVLKEYGFPVGVLNRTAALLDFIRKNVAYAPDALGTEQIQSAAITLCVKGAPVCIPVADCFPEGTLLLRKDGQLVPIEDIEVGEEIWGQNKWVEVQAKVFKGKLRVDAIEMNNGSTMYLTPDHHVYAGRCKHGKSIDCPSCGARPSLLIESWDRIRVGDLQVGESLLQPERITFNGDGTSMEYEGSRSDHLDRLYVEGLAISEGWAEGSRFSISGQDGNRKEALKHEVKAICARLDIPTYWHRKYISINDSGWATRVASFGHLARNKHCETLDLAEDEAAAVLRGIMSDSTANTRGEGRTFSTTSHTLMVQVRVLQRMFGRSTSVKMLTPEQHRGAGKHPLWRVGVRVKSDEHELSRNDKVLAVRGIERAVKKVPCWDIQTTDHHVYLPEHDVTVSQCDDLVTALGTLIAALGMEVRVVRQIFHGDQQQHVLLEVLDEGGKWLAADPTSKTMPVGRKAFAVKETTCSPWDAGFTGVSGDAQFIGIGSLEGAALPVLMLSGGGWHQIDHLPESRGFGAMPENAVWVDIAPGVQARVGTGDIHVEGLGDACCGSCAAGGPCDSEKKKGVSSLGALSPADVAAAFKLNLDPIAVAKDLWVQMQGRTWTQAISLADARALSKTWTTGLDAQSDLITLVMSSAFNVKGLEPRAAADATENRFLQSLNRTWYVLLKRIDKAPTAATSVTAYSGNAAVEVPIALIIALTIGAVVVDAAILFFAYEILSKLLVSIECDREMVRLHAEVDKIVDNHLKTGAPYSADDLNRLDQLEKQQQFVFNGCLVAQSKPPFNLTVLAVGAGIVGITVMGIVYAPEIKALFHRERE